MKEIFIWRTYVCEKRTDWAGWGALQDWMACRDQ